jgi:hypothetical protein
MRNFESTVYLVLCFVAGLGLLAPAASATAPGLNDHVVVNEYQPDPTGFDGNEDAREWVELYNPTPETVDLTGWVLSDQDFCFGQEGERVIEDRQLGPNELTVVEFQPEDQVCLANSFGDDVTLFDSLGNAVDAAYYGNGGDYQASDKASPIPDSGESLARCNLVEDDGFAEDDDNPSQDFYREIDPTKGEPNDRCDLKPTTIASDTSQPQPEP